MDEALGLKNNLESTCRGKSCEEWLLCVFYLFIYKGKILKISTECMHFLLWFNSKQILYDIYYRKANKHNKKL